MKEKLIDSNYKLPLIGLIVVPLVGLASLLSLKYTQTTTPQLKVQVQNTKQEKPSRITNYIPVEVIENGQRVKINVPVYNDSLVPKDKCSKYVRIALKDIMGIEISANTEAWNQRYNAKRIINLKEAKMSLEKLAEKGDIIGIENPQSPYRNYLDWTGNTVRYTHSGLYLGVDPEGKGLIAHKYHEETLVETLQDLEKIRGLRIVEVLKPSPKK